MSAKLPSATISTETILAALDMLNTLSAQTFNVKTLAVNMGNKVLSALAIDKWVLSSKLLDITSAKLVGSALQSANFDNFPEVAGPPPPNNKFKIKRLNELQAQIDMCSAAMYEMPDADVQYRVDLATKNPCIQTDTVFYLNAMYNKDYVVSSEIEAKKYRQTVKKVIRYEPNEFYNDPTYNKLVNEHKFNDNIGFGFVVKNNGLQVKDDIVFVSQSLTELKQFIEKQHDKLYEAIKNGEESNVAFYFNESGQNSSYEYDEFGYAIFILVEPLLAVYGEMVREETDPNYAEYLKQKNSAVNKIKEKRIEDQRKIEAEQNEQIEAKHNEYNNIKNDILKKETELKTLNENYEILTSDELYMTQESEDAENSDEYRSLYEEKIMTLR